MRTSWPSPKPRSQKATERAPWDAATWTEYGVTLRQAGKFAEARAAYEKALRPRIRPTRRHTAISVCCSICTSMIR